MDYFYYVDILIINAWMDGWMDGWIDNIGFVGNATVVVP